MLKSIKLRPKLDLTSFPWTSLPSSLLVSLLLQMFLSELLQWGVHPAPSSPLLCNNMQHVLCSGERTASHPSTSALSESAELFSELSVGFCHLLKSPGWYASALKLKNDTYSTAKQVKLQSQPLVALLDCVSLNTASSDLSHFLFIMLPLVNVRGTVELIKSPWDRWVGLANTLWPCSPC